MPRTGPDLGATCFVMKARGGIDVSPPMNAFTSLRIVLAGLLLPTLAFSARGQSRKRPAAEPAPKLPEVLKTFDKNGNQKIDSDELADLQKTFSELRKLDKNSNGELEVAE